MINEVRLIGYLGSEPEVGRGGSWTRARISLATTKKWKDKGGEWQEKTSWHRLIAWGYVAEYIEKFCKKGTLLYIEGEIEYGSYEKDGQKIYTTDIKVEKARVMNGWKDSNGGSNNQQNNWEPPPMGDDVPF